MEVTAALRDTETRGVTETINAHAVLALPGYRAVQVHTRQYIVRSVPVLVGVQLMEIQSAIAGSVVKAHEEAGARTVYARALHDAMRLLRPLLTPIGPWKRVRRVGQRLRILDPLRDVTEQEVCHLVGFFSMLRTQDRVRSGQTDVSPTRTL
jgi:hypothetical protein